MFKPPENSQAKHWSQLCIVERILCYRLYRYFHEQWNADLACFGKLFLLHGM
jgi:hypothetical protein